MNIKKQKVQAVQSEKQEDQSFHSVNNRSNFSDQSDSEKYYDVNKDSQGRIKNIWNSSLMQSDADFHSVRPNIIKQKQIKQFECSVCHQKEIDCLEAQTVTQQEYQKMKAQIDILTKQHQFLLRQTQNFNQIFKVSRNSSQNIVQEIQSIKKQIVERAKKLQQKSGKDKQTKFGFNLFQESQKYCILNKAMFQKFVNGDQRFQQGIAYENQEHSINVLFRYRINQRGQYSVLFQVNHRTSNVLIDQAFLQFKGQLKKTLVFNLQGELQKDPVKFSIVLKSEQPLFKNDKLQKFLIFPPSLIFLQQRFRGIEKTKIHNLKKTMIFNRIQVKGNQQSNISSIKRFLNVNQWFSLQKNGSKDLLFLHLEQHSQPQSKSSSIVLEIGYKQKTLGVTNTANQIIGIIMHTKFQ